MRTGRPMVVVEAKPIAAEQVAGMGLSGYSHSASLLLSICFIQKIFARCILSLKTSAHTNDGPMPDKTIDLSTEECEGIMHRDHHLQLRSITI